VTAKPINLRQRRKQQKRATDRAAADENATRHGLSGTARNLADARAEKANRDLDGHRLNGATPVDTDD